MRGSRKRHAPLHAAGPLEAMARAWWASNMRQASRLTAITVAGDGHIRFHWEDDDPDFGTFNLPLWKLYADVPHEYGRPVAEHAPQ